MEVVSVEAFVEALVRASVEVAFVEAFVKASVEVVSVEAFMEASVEVFLVEAPVKAFMEASVEVASAEAFVKASVEVASVETSVEDFVEVASVEASVSCFRGSFHGIFFCGSFRGSFHGMKAWKLSRASTKNADSAGGPHNTRQRWKFSCVFKPKPPYPSPFVVATKKKKVRIQTRHIICVNFSRSNKKYIHHHDHVQGTIYQ